MENSIECKWNSEMEFIAEVNGHKIVFDAAEEFGGKDKGPRPKPVLLSTFAGCTGMDIVFLLKKMRIEAEYLNIKVTGTITEDHPKYYYKIHVVYEFKKSENHDKSKIQRAVDLSQEKYCGVGALLKKGSEITYEIVYI